MTSPAASPAARSQAARVLAEMGIDSFHRGRVGSAEIAWERSLAADPKAIDSAVLLAEAARVDRDQVGRMEATLGPALDGMADRVLRADLLAMLGDAYFDSGQIALARQRYAASCEAFTLPKIINHHALRGMGGL